MPRVFLKVDECPRQGWHQPGPTRGGGSRGSAPGPRAKRGAQGKEGGPSAESIVQSYYDSKFQDPRIFLVFHLLIRIIENGDEKCKHNYVELN